MVIMVTSANPHLQQLQVVVMMGPLLQPQSAQPWLIRGRQLTQQPPQTAAGQRLAVAMQQQQRQQQRLLAHIQQPMMRWSHRLSQIALWVVRTATRPHSLSRMGLLRVRTAMNRSCSRAPVMRLMCWRRRAHQQRQQVQQPQAVAPAVTARHSALLLHCMARTQLQALAPSHRRLRWRVRLPLHWAILVTALLAALQRHPLQCQVNSCRQTRRPHLRLCLPLHQQRSRSLCQSVLRRCQQRHQQMSHVHPLWLCPLWCLPPSCTAQRRQAAAWQRVRLTGQHRTFTAAAPSSPQTHSICS